VIVLHTRYYFIAVAKINLLGVQAVLTAKCHDMKSQESSVAAVKSQPVFEKLEHKI